MATGDRASDWGNATLYHRSHRPIKSQTYTGVQSRIPLRGGQRGWGFASGGQIVGTIYPIFFE